MSGREYMPVRPLRGTRVSKDTSGRLMNIIAELSVSKSNDDRQRKMKELKNDFEVSHSKLVELISKKKEHLTVTMETFSAISSRINNSRKGCRDVKDKLFSCQKLLDCKREDIRRLWSESLEHRDVISFLHSIEDLNKVKERVEKFLHEGKFEEATELLVSKISLFDGKLASVDGLKDFKLELNSLSESLHQVLVQELYKHLYMLPEGMLPHIETQQNSKNYVHEAINKKQGELPGSGKIHDSENESKKQFSILLNCVCKLKKISEMVDVVKERCEKELMAIVRKSTVLMCNVLNSSSVCLTAQNSSSDQKCVLLGLLKFILHQFRIVARNHEIFLTCLEKIIEENGITDINYGIADVYSKVQAVVQVFLSTYIDFQNASATNVSSNLTNLTKVPSDISSFFLRKDVTRSKKNVLFKFDCSSHAISMKSYLEEVRKEREKEKSFEMHSETNIQPVLICQPTARNITVLYMPLKDFILELETALNIDNSNGSHCPLHTFVSHCIQIFLDDVNIEVNKLLEKNAHSFETWKLACDSDLKTVGVKTQILDSTIAINSALLDMLNLIKALPDFAHHFLQLVYFILESYKELSHKYYKNLMNPNADEEKTVFSVSWAKDKDICRLLRSLPNWMNLKNMEPGPHEGTVPNEFEESPLEIRFRNKEECDLLMRNLSSKDHVISACEIVRDHKKFKNLALMHESMEWISIQILKFSDTLPDVSIPENAHPSNIQSFVTEKIYDQDGDNGNVKPHSISNTKGCLTELAKEFCDLADCCILVLHLEVRVHCFYYLLPLSKQSSYTSRKDDHEPEPDVSKLNADLCAIDEAISPILQPRKMKYIFEGLGELLSTILINSVSNIKKINENGVKKMGRNIFAIQQNLAGITMTREVALDRARQYFDLLNHSLEDILNQIVEEGPQFQEQEYLAILQLLHNSKDRLDSLSNYREKLRQILDEVAVSV